MIISNFLKLITIIYLLDLIESGVNAAYSFGVSTPSLTLTFFGRSLCAYHKSAICYFLITSSVIGSKPCIYNF